MWYDVYFGIVEFGKTNNMYNFKFLWPWETQNRVKGHEHSRLCPIVNSCLFILSSFILTETREPDDIATGPRRQQRFLFCEFGSNTSAKTNDPLALLPITRHCNNFKICLPCSRSAIRPELCVSPALRGGIWDGRIGRNSTHPDLASDKPSQWIRNKLISCDYRGISFGTLNGFLHWSGIWVNLLTVWEYFDQIPYWSWMECSH